MGNRKNFVRNNIKLLVLIIAFVFMDIVIIGSVNTSSSFATNADNYKLSISCPTYVAKGSTIQCKVFGNLGQEKFTKLEATYGVDDSLVSYASFAYNDKYFLDDGSNSAKGFSLENKFPYSNSDEEPIGYLNLKITDNLSSSSSENSSDKYLGDINKDGIIDENDVDIVRKLYAGGYDLDYDETLGDVNCDGTLNGKDVTIIRKYIAGKEVPTTCIVDKNTTISINNIKLTKDNGDVVSLTDVSENVTIRNSKFGNTALESIKIMAGDKEVSLNESISSDITKYTAYVDSTVSNVKINVKSIDGSVIDDMNSNIEDFNMDLKYGYNRLTFKVSYNPDTSSTEDGTEEDTDVSSDNNTIYRVYDILIKREYTFELDKNSNYIYDKEEGYIYTGMDIDGPSIIAKLNLKDIAMKDYKDNTIKLGDSLNNVIFKAKLLNFSTDYTLNDDIFSIGEKVNYDDFINSFKLRGVTMEVTDQSGKVITSEDIKDGYQVKIKYKNKILATYIISNNYLKIDADNVKVDTDNSIIYGLVIGTKYSDVIKYISTSGSISIKDKDGNIVGESDKVKSNDKIIVSMSGNKDTEYVVSVLGDLNNDGKVDISDDTKLQNYLVGRIDELSLLDKYSADIAVNGKIDISDAVRLQNYLIGRIDSLEVK